MGKRGSFLKKEVWQIQIEQLPWFKGFWIRTLRVLLLTSQGFTKRQIQQGAAALTYYTLLAIVPIIALLIGIARGFLLENKLKAWLLERFVDQADIINKVVEFANASLKQAQGVIAGIGVVLLLWSGLKILMYTELIMNNIWEVKKGRTWARRFSDYFAMMLMGPILVFLASGLTVYLTAALKKFGERGEFFDFIAFPFLHLLPLILTYLLLTFLYIFMPNTRVKLKSAFFASLVTGTIYQVMQWLYLNFQIGISSYNAIYGTFAALPLFLIWIHLSWIIVLMGAKMSFAFQNVNAYEYVTEDEPLSYESQLMCSLRMAHHCITQFCAGKPPPSSIEISNQLAIPLPFTQNILYLLAEAEVLSEVKRDKDEEIGFQPARSVDQLTIKQVMDLIAQKGRIVEFAPTQVIEKFSRSIETFSQLIENSEANILLKDV